MRDTASSMGFGEAVLDRQSLGVQLRCCVHKQCMTQDPQEPKSRAARYVSQQGAVCQAGSVLSLYHVALGGVCTSNGRKGFGQALYASRILLLVISLPYLSVERSVRFPAFTFIVFILGCFRYEYCLKGCIAKRMTHDSNIRCSVRCYMMLSALVAVSRVALHVDGCC